MTPNILKEAEGISSSFFQKLESGLRPLKQRAALDMEFVKTRLAPIKQKGVNMARATKEMSFLTKVELGIAAIGFATVAAELIHDFPYAVGLKDFKDFQPLVVPAVIEMFENMFPPVSSVEDDQVPVPTLVPVTPEGTPLFAGALPSGTAVVEATGEMIAVTPAATATATATDTATLTDTPTPTPTPSRTRWPTPEIITWTRGPEGTPKPTLTLPPPTLRPTDIILSSQTAPAPDADSHFGLPEESWPYIYFDQGTGRWVVQVCFTEMDEQKLRGFTFVEYAKKDEAVDRNGIMHDGSGYNSTKSWFWDYGPCQ